MGFIQLRRPQQPTRDAVPDYLKDKDGNKVKFDPCVIDQQDFKRRMIERKVNGATTETRLP
jgi:hypothetical protein